MNVTTVALIAAVFLLGLETRCDAYIDPSAGGFLVQILAPIGALVVSCFIYFRKQMAGLLQKGKPAVAQPAEPMSPDTEQ